VRKCKRQNSVEIKMAALEKKKSNSTSQNNDIKFDGKELSFLPKSNKRWNLRSTDNGFEFWFNGQSKEKIKRITLSENEITLELEKRVEVASFAYEVDAIRVKGHLRDLFKGSRTLRDNELFKFDGPMLLMMASMNGRCKFDLFSPLMKRDCPETCQEITREILLKMLKRENEVRFSKEMLESFEKESLDYEENSCANDANSSTMNAFVPRTIEQFQRKVVQEFGYKSDTECSYAIQMLRSARSLYPNDLEIKNTASYLKYNRCQRGEIGVGDMYKDVPLANCNQQEIKLSAILNREKPTLVISGSIT